MTAFSTSTTLFVEQAKKAWPPCAPVQRAAGSEGVGLEQARINGKSFTADEPLLDAAARDALEHAMEEIPQAEAVCLFLERQVILDRPIQTEPTEPPIS